MALAVLGSCKQRSGVSQTKDGDMVVQVMQLPRSAGDNNDDISYKVRIIPSKTLMEGKATVDKNGLYYRMDSCFYIKNGGKKQYPDLVQSVANGISGTYEYLLQFEKDDQPADSIDMVYQDRYINKKAYLIRTVK